MKTRTILFFNTEERPWSDVRKLFDDAGRQDLATAGASPDGFYKVEFGGNDPLLHRFRAALSNADIEPFERSENIFTASEIEVAPLLWLVVRTKESGMGGPTYGTGYDLSQACPRCGTGAVQISPLRLKPSEIPKRGTIFQTLEGEILVSRQLADSLSRAEVDGLELRAAQSYKDLAELPWVQLIARVELPPMAPSSKGILREDPCPRCGRDGYFHSSSEPIEIEYSRSQVDLDALPDAVHTYEHFGNSKLREPLKDSHFAQPLLLIKPKVVKVFRREKVRGVEFVPITVES